MAKLVLNDISNLTGNPTSAEQALNDNFTSIETAIENTLSRDGTTPNSLEAQLDANSQRIINLPFALSASEPVTLAQVMNLLTGEDWTGGVGIPAVVYYQPTQPTATAAYQVWVDTTTLKIYIWDGDSWVYVQDPNIQSALDLANGNALDIADISPRLVAVEEDAANVSTAIVELENEVGTLAAQITSVTADQDDLTAAVQAEALARVSGDEALATAINSIQVSNAQVFIQASEPVPGVGGIPDPIPEGSFWYDSDDGNKAYRYFEGAWINVTDSEITVLQAAVTAEQAARIDADSALAIDITNLWAQRNSDYALFTENNLARIDDTTALANTVAVLNVMLGNTNGQVAVNNQARIDGDTALANSITTVSTSVGSLNTTVTSHTSSINGIQGKYGVKIDANGYVTGFGLISTNNNATPTSTFTVLANNFKVVTPGSTPVTPFQVIGGITYIKNVVIDEAAIGNATIGTLNVKSSAISDVTTASYDFFGANGPTLAASQWGNLTTAYGTAAISISGLVVPGTKVMIRAYFNCDRAGDAGETVYVRFRRNDGVILPGSPAFRLQAAINVYSWEFVDANPVSTSHTYTVQVSRTSGTGVVGNWYDMQFVAMALKR
jgi:hypothetical protein